MSPQSLSPDSLPDNCRALLYALATAFPGKGRTSLLKLLRSMAICDHDGRLLDAATLPVLLQLLQDEGWVDVEQRNEGQYFVVPASRRNSVLLSLLGAADGALRLQQIGASLPALGQWQAPGKHRASQELWLNLLWGDGPRLEQWLDIAGRLLERSGEWPALHPMQFLQADGDGIAVFARLDQAVRGLLLEDYLRQNSNRSGAVQASYELAKQELPLCPFPALGLQVMQQALWRGDWETLKQCASLVPLTSQSVQLVLRGQTGEALLLLRSWLTEQRRQTKKNKVDLPPLLNAMYCLALIAENDTKYHGALKQALALGEKQRYGSAYPVLYQLFEQLRGSAPELSNLRSTELDGLDGLLLALAFYWLDAPLAREVGWCTKLQDHRAQLDQQGYAWLAAEFDALISAQFGVPRLLHHVHEDAGLKPFVTLLQRQEAWEHALNALTQLKQASAPAHPAAKKTTRLAWLVNPSGWSTQLEPREQKLSAKGQWSKGRPVALKRLMDEVDSLDFLCEQDRQAIRLIQAGHPYYSHIEYQLPLGVALPKLVGQCYRPAAAHPLGPPGTGGTYRQRAGRYAPVRPFVATGRRLALATVGASFTRKQLVPSGPKGFALTR